MANRIFALAFLLCVPAAFGAGAASENKYVGPGSCSATACHGGVQPLALTSVLQNEYTTWAVQDPHAKAYRSLENAVSQRMARILGIGDATKAHKCLVCHALDASAEQKGRDFDIGDGVSCESCHGPASAWLGPHTLKGSAMEKFTGMGMINLKNLERRAEQCNTCHVGTREKEVDHDMIGAGHPDLVFELDSYDAIMPPHWKPAPDPNEGIRTWSVGQATYLRDALERLARHAQKPEWPEYSELDCFACHHSLSKPENSWRQDRGYPGRAIATPPWNASHYMVFRILARDLDDASGRQMESELDSLYKLMSSRNASKRTEIADTAKRASEMASRYVEKINQSSFDRARTARLLEQIAGEANQFSENDTRTAEQAAMALDSLFISYSRQGGSASPAVRTAINGLFQQLDNPSAYSAPRFNEQMHRVSAALRESGIGGGK